MIKLLELPTLQLEQRVKQEIEENPVLEEEQQTAEESTEDNGMPKEVSMEEYLKEAETPAYKSYVNNYSRDDKARQVVGVEVNRDAVRDAIDSGQVDYNVLIHLEKDETGRVAALESNMAAFNRLRSQIADEILRRLSEVSTSELSIPVGTLTGSTLLAGRGPCIRVRMQAVGSTDASLRNAFSAAGINQTRHQILLSVDVYTSILLPGFTASTKVSNEIAVAETVIVGSVPETYTYFSTTPEELEDTARDNIMNKG